jgi:DNA modification methylase
VSVILCGDCLDVLRGFPDDCIDLIVTSPPYADRRKGSYGGIPGEKYVQWFLPRSAEFLRVLGRSGSFILNIKEGTVNGERQTYVMELVLALRQQGWKWIEEYSWYKTSSMPGFWPTRFRDAWEHLFHFAKTLRPFMDQDAVRVPAKPSTIARGEQTARADEREAGRDNSENGSGFGIRRTCAIGVETVLPDNVLRLCPESRNKRYPSALPLALPQFFVRLLCPPGGSVLDPSSGSGTTCVAAEGFGRQAVGIDMSPEYCEVARQRMAKATEDCPFTIQSADFSSTSHPPTRIDTHIDRFSRGRPE